MKYLHIALAIVLVLISPISANSQSGHEHSNHNQVNKQSILSEPGQGAFASLTEVVQVLNADQTTDWETVNIRALRDHLVDMNDLILKTEYQVFPIENGLRFEFDNTLNANSAATRMVPAHSAVLQNDSGWNSHIENSGKKLVWEVTSTKDIEKIARLGFFGLMATGDHHREHHLAIATGKNMH